MKSKTDRNELKKVEHKTKLCELAAIILYECALHELHLESLLLIVYSPLMVSACKIVIEEGF